MNWTAATWAKVTFKDELGTNITRDFLRPQTMHRPHTSHPISVQWGEQVPTRLSDRQAVIFGSTEVSLIMVDLEIAEVAADRSVSVKLIAEGASLIYRLTISDSLPAGYKHEHIDGPHVRFRKGRDDDIAQLALLDPSLICSSERPPAMRCSPPNGSAHRIRASTRSAIGVVNFGL
jgi:hypothetical protein